MIGAIDRTTGKFTSIKYAVKGNEYQCICCNEKLIFRAGEINIPHFSHSPDTNCNGESYQHKLAKYLLKYILENNIELVIINGCHECDSQLKTSIINLTVGPIVYKHVELEYHYDSTRKSADVAMVLDNDCIIFEVCKSNPTDEENRQHKNIKHWFEIDANEIINKYNNLLDSDSIELQCIRKCSKCKEEHNKKIIKEEENKKENNECGKCKEEHNKKIIKEEENKKENNECGKIYVNQRGAGSGKTYESVQILNSTDSRFTEKDTYIYLTKMHSAKDVILDEIKSQEKNGILNNIKSFYTNTENKQYVINYNIVKNNKLITVIIGTIDSFNYAVVDKYNIKQNFNYFDSIVESIKINNVCINNNGVINYAKTKQFLNEKCLVIIDEAQDLCVTYIEAFDTIVTNTNIDVYVIGDKLQSISGDFNIITEILNKNHKLKSKIIPNFGTNKVMRFHNNNLKKFVNDIIPFGKYGLEEIKNICTSNCCKYEHEDEIIPYNIFPSLNIYSRDGNLIKIIYKIIKNMEIEVTRYNYLPDNFMFIFPFITKNTFADLLALHVNEFWISKFNDINYTRNIEEKDIDINKYINANYYTYIHRSNENEPIDLKISEFATRMLSIHSSKGLGCEVVFVMGITESTLKTFSKGSELIYDSLLHVALTRVKKSIYVGIVCNNDDIHKKFYNLITNDDSIEPILNIKNTIKLTYISNDINDDSNYFKYINDNFIEANNYKELIPNIKSHNQIIDYGHHMIRYGVFRYFFMLNLIGNFNNASYNSQYITILRNLSEIKLYEYDTFKDYTNALKSLDESIKKRIQYVPYLY
jgi:hypothetical protein